MSNHLRELLTWFPSGTAEGDKPILDRVFVPVQEFAGVMGPPAGSPHLLIGSKGSGKSAIFEFALKALEAQDVPAVMLTPFDFDTVKFTDNSSTGDMTREFTAVLLSTIAAKLSEQSTGWFDGDHANLYREAVDSGKRSPDFVSRMARFIGEVAKPITKIDFDKAFPHLTKITKDELTQSVGQALTGTSFYLFIDDTDQIANPDKPGQLNRIWSLILAVRRLASKVPELRAVVSLRSEVWERLKSDPAGQRDQTDHFQTLIVRMRADRKHVEDIIHRRLGLAADKVRRQGDLYGPFFEGQGARAPFSEDVRFWKDLIVVRSRNRPRDAIQLINGLAKRALEDKKDLIDEETFQSVVPVFSDRVAHDFAKEVILEIPVGLEVLRTFAGADYDHGSFTFGADAAFAHFKKVLTRFRVTLQGMVLSQTNESHIFELWRFFFMSGILNARVSDISAGDGFRHLDPEKDSSLVSKARWNDVQKALWEINPIYRDFLITVSNENASMTGLPIKRPSQPSNTGRRKRR